MIIATTAHCVEICVLGCSAQSKAKQPVALFVVYTTGVFAGLCFWVCGLL